MNPLFKKLNYKSQPIIHVLASPDTFKAESEDMRHVATVKTSLGKEPIAFVIAFVTRQQEVDDWALKISSIAEPDATIWFAYPKQSSKRYKCEFNRDNGWQKLGDLGYEGVRMVAIDEDWSALRFRKAEMLSRMTRRSAMSETGKQRIAAKKK